MRVLIACEFSGVVRRAFRAQGIEAWSCDLLPTEDDGPHIHGDVRDVLGWGWDLMVAHPPCTYLCSSGLHWNTRRPGRAEETEKALEFVRLLLDAPIPRIALENPRSPGMRCGPIALARSICGLDAVEGCALTLIFGSRAPRLAKAEGGPR